MGTRSPDEFSTPKRTSRSRNSSFRGVIGRTAGKTRTSTPETFADTRVCGRDDDVWRYTIGDAFKSVADARAWIEALQASRDEGSRIPFAIVDRAGSNAVGSTSYLDIRREHRSIEIGYTWIAVSSQRTHVNTQCKLALMTHAFETLGANRVQLRTDLRNHRSQKAIERVGAVREGVLRQSMVLPSGYVRDTVFYSVIASEWPAVKTRLQMMAELPRS